MALRLVLVLAPVALAATLVGCNNKPAATNNKAAGTSPAGAPAATASTPDDPNADVGTELYRAAPAVVVSAPAASGKDPIAIPCTVQMEDKQSLSAEVDGMVVLVGTPLDKNPQTGQWSYTLKDPTTGAEKVVVYDSAHPHPAIAFHPRDKEKKFPYWKLVDGDRVVDGQILCVLDNDLWTSKKSAAEKNLKASNDARKSADLGVKYSKEKVDLDLRAGVTVARADLLNDLITLERFNENLYQADQGIAKAEGDLEEANINLKKHEITSRVNGIIRSITKRQGETVKATEKIMEIQSTDRVRLEGMLDVQYFDRVKRHMEVSVEPAIPSAPIRSHSWHRAEVAGIAVTGHARHPLVISASMDGSALVWDPNLANETGGLVATHTLPHPVGVRTVACTPPGVSPVLAVTGAEDGKLRIWDVTNPSNLPKSPTKEPADSHGSGIHAMAISPDGKYVATAAGREIFIWDLATGTKKYALPQEHRDTVTSLAFTPQTQLVTAAKDNTIKVWKLGAEKAAVAKTIEHRSGSLDTLGVSPDGGRVLFDQDKGRLDLVSLTTAQTSGQLSNVGPNMSFSTLAVFAPDKPGTQADKPYFIATAGGEGDLKGGLQIWKMSRAGGRAAEVGRLMTPGRVPVTCAAFSQNIDGETKSADKGNTKDRRFLVVGTDRGTVHLWTPPDGPPNALEGRVTNIESSDPRFVTVRVEMTNKDLGLLDRSAATVIVDPAK